MKTLITILAISYLLACNSFEKKKDVYVKYHVLLEQPGITALGENGIVATKDRFYSKGNYNIFTMISYRLRSPNIADDLSNHDTVFVTTDLYNVIDTILTGYLIYSFNDKKKPGLIISNHDNKLVNVDSFFNKNGSIFKLNFKAIKDLKLVGERLQENILIKIFSEVNSPANNDSLLFYYSKGMEGVNYSFTNEYTITGMKLFRIDVVENTNGYFKEKSLMRTKIGIEIVKDKIEERDKKLIDSCINIYNSYFIK